MAQKKGEICSWRTQYSRIFYLGHLHKSTKTDFKNFDTFMNTECMTEVQNAQEKNTAVLKIFKCQLTSRNKKPK